MNVPIYSISDGLQRWAIILSALGAVASLALCLRVAVARRSALPVYLFLGGALAIFVEPFPDILGHAVFPEIGQIGWIDVMGRQIPMYVGLIYLFFFAPPVLYLLRRFERGITPRGFAVLCGAVLVGATAFEWLALRLRLWVHYGEQPYAALLFWGVVNSHLIMAVGVAVFLLSRLIPANRQFVFVILLPPIAVGAHTAGLMAGAIGLSSTGSRAVLTLTSLASVVVCLVLLRVYSLAVCRPAAVPVHPDADLTAAAR
jgi:hypothetical protein